MPDGRYRGEMRSTSICRCRWYGRGWRRKWTLDEFDYHGGPARYVRVRENRRPARLHHAADAQFLRELKPCALTCTGTLYMCPAR